MSLSKKTKVAMILAGCGVYEGSQCTESVVALIHLSRNNCVVQAFAPNKDQMHAVNHCSGKEHSTNRNVLVESARIARGNVKDIVDCEADNFDALVIPGGFGVAKNLSNFAVTAGAGKSVDKFFIEPEVSKVILDFHSKRKPIGMTCIAPVLVAKLIPGVKITMGSDVECDEFPYAGAVGAVKALGANHVNTEPPCNVACVDEDNLVVTSPAYMYNAAPHEVYDSAGAMVTATLNLVLGIINTDVV